MKNQNQQSYSPVRQQQQETGRAGSSGPLEILTQDLVIDFPSIPTITAPDSAVVVPGSLLNDNVLCLPQGTWPPGLTLPQGRALADGTVQFRIANVTAGALDPASQTCRLTTLRIRP